ncbi:hypothetical protein [Saccharibacillus endophyticus]|uniref:WxL domain-containing protein n=1 Tax=Saccharibacillus endophyticus TaxID=2060666 RepID=A0ABQ2A874_9BACL|nr:hypothetical protein [Saccharibacillus endophyticus]GGH87442.1 hypothetical protein GCM10007362_49580 [Saccharibacillus endophyticus]
MKKLVTTLTASALLMGSLATAVSAAETSATVTDATYTSPTTGTVVTGTTKFVGNNKAFSFTNPTAWNERVSSQEYTGTALTEMGETAANYMVNFTYKPTDSNATPVVFATIRGYDSSVWNGLTNKETLGTPLNTTGGTIYVLSKVASNPFPATSAADQNAFNELLQSTNSGALQGFMVNPATGTLPSGPVVSTDDPSKVSTNPTPNIQLTSMTPFYKSPGGTMIGYLGPQKLDTTGKGQTDPASGQWVEIYTWMGLAWIVVE